eukprot:Polyplicarium_translucidae@DN2412_c0_g1_i8.p1
MSIFWIFLAALANGQAYFRPRFHTPNLKAYDGSYCADNRPSRPMVCPTFCVRTRDGDTFLNQMEFEERCVGFSDPLCDEGPEDCATRETESDASVVEVGVALDEDSDLTPARETTYSPPRDLEGVAGEV